MPGSAGTSIRRSTPSMPSSAGTSLRRRPLPPIPSSSTSMPSSAGTSLRGPLPPIPSSRTSMPSSAGTSLRRSPPSSSRTSRPSSSSTSMPRRAISSVGSIRPSQRAASLPRSPVSLNPISNTSRPSSSSNSMPRRPISSDGSTRPARPAASLPRLPTTKVGDSSPLTINRAESCNETTKKTHPSHPRHPLEKVNRQYAYKCSGCKMLGVGERHRCVPCNFNLHRDCMFARPSITLEGYNYRLSERPRRCRGGNCCHGEYCRSCDACGMTVEGFVYHCEENDGDFHPSCANLKPEIRVDDVIFKLEKQGSAKCLHCQRKKLEGACKNVPGRSYVSSRLGYTLHVHCLMDMAIQCSSNNNVSSNSGSSSSSLALQNVELPLGSKPNNGLKLLETFLKIVIPTLMGAHPATFVLSLAATGVKELFDLFLD